MVHVGERETGRARHLPIFCSTVVLYSTAVIVRGFVCVGEEKRKKNDKKIKIDRSVLEAENMYVSRLLRVDSTRVYGTYVERLRNQDGQDVHTT